MIQLASALVVGFALVIPANAAATSARKSVRAECVRLADAQNFGKRHIQRRNFIQDCLIERGYRTKKNQKWVPINERRLAVMPQ